MHDRLRLCVYRDHPCPSQFCPRIWVQADEGTTPSSHQGKHRFCLPGRRILWFVVRLRFCVLPWSQKEFVGIRHCLHGGRWHYVSR